MKKLILAVALALAAAPVASAADKAAVESSLNDTEARLDAIIETGFVWRWTYDRIKEAREAVAAGNMDEAEDLAALAAREADLAYEQIATADKFWEIAVPK